MSLSIILELQWWETRELSYIKHHCDDMSLMIIFVNFKMLPMEQSLRIAHFVHFAQASVI